MLSIRQTPIEYEVMIIILPPLPLPINLLLQYNMIQHSSLDKILLQLRQLKWRLVKRINSKIRLERINTQKK